MCERVLQVLEEHALDADGALACYRAAEQMEQGRTDLRVLAPLARLLLAYGGESGGGDVELALAAYTKAVVISSDALDMALKGEKRMARRRRSGLEPDPQNGVAARVHGLCGVHSSLLVGYGDALRAKGLWREAEDAYLTVLQSEANATQAQLGLLFTLLDSGEDPETAQVLLSRLTDADVRDARLWLEHGKQVSARDLRPAASACTSKERVVMLSMACVHAARGTDV